MISFKEFKPKMSKILDFKNYQIHNWLIFIGLFIFLISFAMTVISFIFAAIEHKDLWTVFDKFTNQTNWIIFIYTIVYFFFPHKPYFKNDIFLLAATTYIFITFFGYNIIIVGIGQYPEAYKGTPIDIFIDIWKHIIAPLYFIVLAFFSFKERPNCFPKSYWYSLFISSLYPIVYLIYVVSIPFIMQTTSIDLNGNIIYSTYSVYEIATNTKENPMAWLYVFMTFFVILPIAFYIFWFLWKKLSNKLIEKNNKQ